jgi:hypothetical protein
MHGMCRYRAVYSISVSIMISGSGSGHLGPDPIADHDSGTKQIPVLLTFVRVEKSCEYRYISIQTYVLYVYR